MALILTDQSNNGHTLTNNGATEYTVSLPYASLTEAVQTLAASTQYLTAVDAAALHPTSFTIEAWLKYSGTNTYDYNIFQSGELTGAGHFGGLSFRGAGGTAGKVQIITGDDNTNDYVLTANTVINSGTWHHVAATYDNSGPTFAIYLDNNSTADATGAGGTPIYPATNYIAVGTRFANGGTRATYFDGQIAEIRFWNTVRTGAQIAANYNQLLKGSESGLIAYWPFMTLPSSTSGSFLLNSV